jgi:hypothetical protein
VSKPRSLELVEHERDEALREIERHHELIAWMRAELAWCAGRLESVHPRCSAAILERLNREVG